MSNKMVKIAHHTALLGLLLFAALAGGATHASYNRCSEKVADVVFLLDSSHSIWDYQFMQQLHFLQRLVDVFTVGPNHIRVGVATFSTEVRPDMTLGQYSDALSLRRAIGHIRYMEGGTMTHLALRYSHSHMFTEEQGSRPWAAHVIILVTDGLSFDTNKTRHEAAMAKNKGIEIFAIGVGNGAQEEELRAVATDPDDSHVFQVESYEALQGIESALAKKTCHKVTNSTAPEGDNNDGAGDTVDKRCGQRAAEVFLLLDSSSSIWLPHFHQQLQFVEQLLGYFTIGPQHTRLGLAVFSDDVISLLRLTDEQDDVSVRKAVHRAPYLAGQTNTGQALHYVRTKGFAEARRKVARLIIVLTDGQSSNTTHTLEEARALREQGVHVFSVGIGVQTDVKELMEMASDPDENYVFQVNDFQELNNIRELLAIKACDVETLEYQGDQGFDGNSDCFISVPSDVTFVYDSADVSRVESDLVADAIAHIVVEMESGPDVVRYGLLRGNAFRGDNVDVRPGATQDRLLSSLHKTHHEGLHKLLQKLRLQGYLATYDPTRADARKMLVVFVGSKMYDPDTVQKEVKRTLFARSVKMLTVLVDSARDHKDLFHKLTGIAPVTVESYEKLRDHRGKIHNQFCQLYRLYN